MEATESIRKTIKEKPIQQQPIAREPGIPPSTAQPQAMRYVWDRGIRSLHWINAALILFLALSGLSAEWVEETAGERFEDLLKQIHAVAGHLLILTFTLRIVWGFVGNEYARWSDIVPVRREQWVKIRENLQWHLGGLRGTPPVSIGHNPLASLFYLVLFVVLAGQAVTGFLLTGLELKMAPATLLTGGLGEVTGEGLEDFAGEVHEIGIWFIGSFVVAHLAGLLIHETRTKGGLLMSMIHGRKN